MYRSRLAGMLASPSLLSACICIFLSGAILVIAGWSYVTPESGLYEYIFGPYGLTTVWQNSSNALTAINSSLSGTAAYNIAVVIFAALVGLVVYVFLQGIDNIKDKATGARQEVEFISDANLKRQAGRQARIRLGLRLATLVVWICYLVIFARIIMPACLLLVRLEVTPHILTWRNVTMSLAGFLVLLVAMHVHVIFMRLLALRPRLFGGNVVGRGGHDE